MTTQFSFSRFFRLAALLSLLLIISGCSFDPTERVHSGEQPEDHTTDDGITWTAFHSASNPHEWVYTPYEFAVIAGLRSTTTELPIDIVVKGKTFRFTKNGNSYSYLGPVESYTAFDPFYAGLIGAGAVFILALLIINAMLDHYSDYNDLEQRALNAESAMNTLEKERDKATQALNREQREIKHKEADLEKSAEKLREQIEAERQELAQQKEIQLLATKASQDNLKAPTKEEWEKVSTVVRAEQFRGSNSNREITVQHYLDPKRSGSILFDYCIVSSLPSPTLVVLRNGKEIHREAGVYNGRFSSLFRKNGQRFKFEFKLFNGERPYRDPLLIELTQPPFQAWVEPPEALEKTSKQQWIADQIVYFKKMNQWPADEAARKELMAKLEAEALDKFGEAE